MKSCLPWFAIGLFASQPVLAPEVSPHATRVVEIVQKLRAIGVPETDEERIDPPPKVPGLLRTLNAELKTLLIDVLNDQRRHDIPSEAEVLDQLRKAGWEEVPSHKWSAYGEIRQVKFDWQVGYDPGVLIVSTELWIPCGSADPDSAIYVFQGRGRKWNLVLATESDFEPVGEDADNGMQYQISPPDDAGHWFLVVAKRQCLRKRTWPRKGGLGCRSKM